jgi:molybdopterin synthase catalytic subunit
VSTGTSPPSSGVAHPVMALERAREERCRDGSWIAQPARRVVFTSVNDEPLDVVAHEAMVAGRTSGAVVTFTGVVRDHDGGRPVLQVEYVGHPSVSDVLAAVVAEVTERSDVDAVAVSHRLGELGVGTVALVVAVASAHRQEAFLTAALLVDEVKNRVPVWKRQLYADGSNEWISC